MQMFQLLDAGLIGFAFWLASWPFNPAYGSQMSLSRMSWVLYIVVPFTPLLLEFLRFYTRPEAKTSGQSLGQLGTAMLFMALLIGVLLKFIPVPGEGFLILCFGGLFSVLALFGRDRLLHGYRSR